MKDHELRGLILRKYYEKRRQGLFGWKDDDFKDLPDSVVLNRVDLFRACDQLAEHGLIEWHPVADHLGNTCDGIGKISASGADVVEGHKKSPISITINESPKISVQNSSHVQIGDGNVQGITIEVDKIISAINNSKASEASKAEAKSLLKKFLEHPLVAAIAGGLASNIK